MDTNDTDTLAHTIARAHTQARTQVLVLHTQVVVRQRRADVGVAALDGAVGCGGDAVQRMHLCSAIAPNDDATSANTNAATSASTNDEAFANADDATSTRRHPDPTTYFAPPAPTSDR
jgi:hypothetical protein